MIDLKWFQWMRKITEEFQRQKGGDFTLNEQIAEIHREIAEFFDSLFILHGLNIHRKETLGEIYDLIFSGFTLMHVLDYSDEEMKRGLEETIEKLELRSKTNYYEGRE